MQVVVFANVEDPESGYVGAALEARGARFVNVWREDLADPETRLPQSPDLVLSLGSEWHVYEPATDVAVGREADYLRQGVDAGTPVLGICFGAQVLSHALGGEVTRHPDGGEVGWYRIESDDPAIPEGPYVQWHSDVFTVPPGARELARSAVGPQAFACGSAFAVQFHPEVEPDALKRWADGGRHTLDARGLDAEALVAEGVARDEAARGHAEALVEAFLSGEFRTP